MVAGPFLNSCEQKQTACHARTRGARIRSPLDSFLSLIARVLVHRGLDGIFPQNPWKIPELIPRISLNLARSR